MYFFDRFVPGQGTQEILLALEQVGAVRNWLDVGSGTTTLFWSIPLKCVESVDCCDLVPEALYVLAEFVRSDEIPVCYNDVLALFGKNAGHLEQMRTTVREYFVFNAFESWPASVPLRLYDLVTAIGIFGLASTAEAYSRSLERLEHYVRPGGWVIGADWLRSKYLIDREHHNNSYLCTDLVADSCRRMGFNLVTCSSVEIIGDPLYDGLIVWALKK